MVLSPSTHHIIKHLPRWVSFIYARSQTLNSSRQTNKETDHPNRAGAHRKTPGVTNEYLKLPPLQITFDLEYVELPDEA